MSSLIGDFSPGKAGLIVLIPEGRGEEKLDAISADVIPQGAVIFRDVANATPALRKWKLPGTAGGQVGPFGVCTKAKIAGETKVTGVWGRGWQVTVISDGAIEPDATGIPSTTNDGNLIAGTGATAFCRYLRRYRYANDGDGNHQKVAAAATNIIVVELL